MNQFIFNVVIIFKFVFFLRWSFIGWMYISCTYGVGDVLIFLGNLQFWDCHEFHLISDISHLIFKVLLIIMVIFLFWWSFLGFWGHIHFWNTNYFWSRLNFWCCINLLGSLQFWGCPHFLGRSHLWGCLHFWASLHFGGCLHVLGRDTSFLACFWHTKKYLQEVLSLKVGKCIHFLNNMWFKDLFFP